MTTKRFVSWKSRSCPRYVEPFREDDHECLSTLTTQALTRGQSSQKNEEGPSELSVWTAATGKSVEVRSRQLQSTSCNNGKDKRPRYQDDRHHEDSSQSSLSPGQSSITRSPREITSIEKESPACETLLAVNSTNSPRPYKGAEGDGKRNTQVSAPYSCYTHGQPHMRKEGEDSGVSKGRLPASLDVKNRQFMPTNRDPQDIQLSNAGVPLGYYEAWEPPTGVTATLGTEWENGARSGNEAIPAESFSNVLRSATLTASPNINKNEASDTTTEATYLHTIEKLSSSVGSCENHHAHQQSSAQNQAQPVAASSLESLDPARCSPHESSPPYNLKTPQIHEEVVTSTVANDLYPINCQHPPTHYFTSIQHSNSALPTRPLQSRLLHPFLQHLPSDKPLPFLLPPLSPSGQGAGPHLNPSRTSPSSPRILPGSLFCCSLPICETSGAREAVRISDPTSLPHLNLPGSPPQSPLFKEPTCENSHCSPAVVSRSRQLSGLGESAAHDHRERNASTQGLKAAAAVEEIASAAPPSSSRTSQDFSHTEQCHAASEAPHLSCVPPRQCLQLVETAGATKIEQNTGEHLSKLKTTPDLHGSSYFDNKQRCLINRESGMLITEAATPSDTRKSHNSKENPTSTDEEADVARRNASWTDTSSLTKDDRSTDSNFFFVKEAVSLSISAQAPSSDRNLALDTKKPLSPTYVPASPPVEDEGLPPLLLGRNSLPPPPEDRKPHPYGYVNTIDHPQQRMGQSAGLFLPEQRTEGFSTQRAEPSGVLPDPNKLQQPDVCSDWPQQVPPFAAGPSVPDELGQHAGTAGSSLPFLFPQQMQQPFQYACTGTVDTPVQLVADTAVASAYSLSQQAQLPTATQQLRMPHELDTKSLSLVGPPTLLGSYPFALPNAFWGASRQLNEPAADHVGQQVYGYHSVLACPLLASQRPPTLQESDAAAIAAFNCGLPLPPPWLSGTPPENVPVGPAGVTSADNLQRRAACPDPLSPRDLSDASFCIPRMVAVPSVLRGGDTDLSLQAHPHAGPAHETLSFLPPAGEVTATSLPLAGPGEPFRKAGAASSRTVGESGRCSLRLAKSSRKRRLLQNSAPPESASRDHKDFLLELLAGSLEPVKGVHMDRLRKTWVASWLVGKRRVTRIFSFQKFGFFGAREQAIRQRREALLNPELESEEAQRVVTAAAAAAAAAIAPNASAVCTATEGARAADLAEQHQSTTDPDRRLVQKIADSLPFVVGVTYHGESFSWIANHRKPMGKIVARRRFSIAEYGFLEARRRAAVMMFHWHKQGRVVEPEDYDQGAAAIFNAQQRPQLPDTANSEGFVYWYPACTANEPLYLMSAFDEESCDEAMVLLASICGNPWKKVCKGQPQGGAEEVSLSGGETVATARFLSSFHSEGACTNWYLSNSQRRERHINFWEGLKKGRHHLDAGGTCPLSPRKRLKSSVVSRKNSHAKKYASSDVQEAQPLRSLLASPGRRAEDTSSKRPSQAPCKDRSALREAGEDDDNSCWGGKTGKACQAVSSKIHTVHAVSYTQKDAPNSLKHHVVMSSRMRERSGGETRKKAALLRNSVSAAHICSAKENAPFCSSMYWTRRKQAEHRARKGRESDTEVQTVAEKGDALGSSESAPYKADTQHQRPEAQEQPHSAQDVLRACFGSEPASATCSGAVSQDMEETEALTCQPPSVEAEETVHEAEEGELEEGEEEEEVGEEEDEEEEEPITAVLQDTGSAPTSSVGAVGIECENLESTRHPTLPLFTSSQPVSQDNLSEFNRLKSVRSAQACEEDLCKENPLSAQQLGHGRIFDNETRPFAQASHPLESTCWFPDSLVKNVTLTQQQQDQFYQNLPRNEAMHSSAFPAPKRYVGVPPLRVLDNPPAPLWRAGKKSKQVVSELKENISELPRLHTEKHQNTSSLIMPQPQLRANMPFECSDAAPLPCRMELAVHESFSK